MKTSEVHTYKGPIDESSGGSFDLARLQQHLGLIAHRPIRELDRERLLRHAQSVIEALYDRRSLRIIAARCEGLIFAAAMLVKKAEFKEAKRNGGAKNV